MKREIFSYRGGLQRAFSLLGASWFMCPDARCSVSPLLPAVRLLDACDLRRGWLDLSICWGLGRPLVSGFWACLVQAMVCILIFRDTWVGIDEL